MKKTKFSDEKIAYVLRQVEGGTTDVEVCREHGVSEQTFYSTKKPKTVWSFERGEEQEWNCTDLVHAMAFPVVTGGISEVGFSDVILQMLAAFVAERAGELTGRFGCVTLEEAVRSHELWQAALQAHQTKCAVEL